MTYIRIKEVLFLPALHEFYFLQFMSHPALTELLNEEDQKVLFLDLRLV